MDQKEISKNWPVFYSEKEKKKYRLTVQLYQYFLHAFKRITIRRVFYSTKYQFFLNVMTDLVPFAPCAELNY